MRFSSTNHQPRAAQRGIALVIVMIVVISLSLLAGGFVMSMKIETKLARNAQTDPQLDWLGRSGVELARYVLGQSLNIPNERYDGLNQFWAGGTGGTNIFPPEISLTEMALGDGTFSVKITDMERRFNINVADEQILQQALRIIGVDASEFGTITGSILDWIDPDDDMHIGGVESDFYLQLDPPYAAKNGPLDDLSELLMVNGISPQIYWGAAAGGQAGPRPRTVLGSRPGSAGGLGYAVGLVDLFTPVSNPRMNINTAGVAALMLIPGMDENLAAGIVSARSGPDGVAGNADDMPFQSLGELASAVPGLDPVMVQQLARYCDTRSATFEVEVTATVGDLRREYVALLRRNQPQDVQILRFYWK